METAVHSHLGGVVSCYEHALRQDHTLAGKIQLRFHVSAAGVVTRTSIEEDTIGDSAVASCLAARVRTWAFPALGCGELEFSYPFIFVPAR